MNRKTNISQTVTTAILKTFDNSTTFQENYSAEYSRSYVVNGKVVPKKKEDWWD